MKSFWSNFLIAANLMSVRLGRNVITILLLTAGFLLSGMTLICANISDYDRIEYKRHCDISRTGCMANENEGGDLYRDPQAIDFEERVDLFCRRQPYQKFYNRLKGSGLVEKCGQYSIIGTRDVDKDIVKIQAGHQIGGYAEMGCVEYTDVQRDVFDIYDIRLDTKVDREEWGDDGIILGSGFREKYSEVEYIYCKGEKRRLLGFVEEGQKLPFEEIAHKGGTALTGLYNLDYAFFLLVPEDFYSGFEIHFRLAEGVTKEEFRSRISEMAKEEHADIRFNYFLDEHLAELERTNIDMLGYINEFAVFILAIITLNCIFVKVHSIFDNRRLYGILYSSGMSMNQINFLFVIENGVILLFSLIAAYLCLYHGLYLFCDYFGAQSPHLIIGLVRRVLLSRVFWQEFLICLLMVGVTSGIPMAVFSRLSPLSLMRDFYE